ncbi:MAG: hypothetical protein FWF08_04240 [Oscillospiraceae bacterium]|nr:hypothetical protein [Oscillospiraceae bacterium]
MANCPKCDYHLKLTDWRPECPKCGVNLVYYGMEERLRAEADKAEYEHAMFQPKVDRLKASFIGTIYTKVRIGVYVLPLLALLIPTGVLSVTLPFYAEKTTVYAVSVVMKAMDLDFGLIFGLISNSFVGKGVLFMALALVCYALSIVVILFELIFLMLSCSPKGFVRNLIFNFSGFFLAIGSGIFFRLACNFFNGLVPDAFSGKAGFGYIVVAAMFLLCVVINFICKDTPVKYTDVSQFLLPYAERDVAKQEAEAAEKAEKTADGEAVMAAVETEG